MSGVTRARLGGASSTVPRSAFPPPLRRDLRSASALRRTFDSVAQQGARSAERLEYERRDARNKPPGSVAVDASSANAAAKRDLRVSRDRTAVPAHVRAVTCTGAGPARLLQARRGPCFPA